MAAGWLYLRDYWNYFDCSLIFLALVDLAISSILESDASLDVVIMLRMIRCVKLIRLFRLFRFFKPLWLIVCGVVSSLRTLCWAWLLLIIVIYVFTLFALKVLDPWRRDPDMKEYFGNVPIGMFTIFQ